MALAFAFEGLPPLWLFVAYLLIVFLCVGLLFGNLNALAMEPLGHLAGVGSAVVTSLSVFVSVPLGTLVGLSFDGTMYAQIAAFAVFGAGPSPRCAGPRRSSRRAQPGSRRPLGYRLIPWSGAAPDPGCEPRLGSRQLRRVDVTGSDPAVRSGADQSALG